MATYFCSVMRGRGKAFCENSATRTWGERRHIEIDFNICVIVCRHAVHDSHTVPLMISRQKIYKNMKTPENCASYSGENGFVVKVIMSKRIETRLRYLRKAARAFTAAMGIPIFIGMQSVPAAPAQDPLSPPRFEAADVHLSPPARNPYNYASGGVLRGERYDLRKATMLDLITTAWNVDSDTVFGGPNWLELDRFDIYAKARRDTPPETVRLMLQALLRDRFGLVIHEATRPLPSFALTVGENKPKMTESNGSTVPGCEYQPAISGFQVNVCRNITMDAFVLRLRQIAPDYLAAPVVNETGLEGTWDFDLKWNNRSRIPQPDVIRTTIFNAVDQQLGLKLAPKIAPATVLVVDRVNEKPTPNSPDTEKLLPTRAVQFEVADVKPSRPGELNASRVFHDRYELRARPLGPLIIDAFDIPGSPLYTSDLIVGIPKWVCYRMDCGQRFDITAKLPSDFVGPAGNAWTDDLRLMLRNLLIERFGIKFHYEDRPVPAYTLVSAKPKMKKADPSHRSSCKEARVIADDPRDSNPRLDRLVTCQNVTMTQFAALLQGLAPIDVGTPVENATRLDGAWDFTLSFSSPQFLSNAATGENAPDANGAISLQDAISKQLGLKLEKRRRPVPVLVIDHIEEKPAEN
jgi:uncharacterized protein (TIGR03435 family)